MTPTVEEVEKILDEVRPYLKSDGGDVKVLSVANGTLKLSLLGNCTNCSVRESTLKLGIETLIKKHFPEITEVVNIPHLSL